MNLTKLIDHPELMNKETLYELRSFVALYPYYQTARLLMLQNLYLLHDTSFDEELRRAAIFLTDRKRIFNLVEAAHFEFRHTPATQPTPTAATSHDADRTTTLIDNFLEQVPAEPADEEETKPKRERKPTPADAAVDYVRYLLDMEDIDQPRESPSTPQLKGQDLIDTFINKDGGRIQLKDEPEYLPVMTQSTTATDDAEGDEDGIFTETLAKIYIKQGRYDKALEIIQRLNLNYPKKNAYFADQIRFLRKLIINNNINK